MSYIEREKVLAEYDRQHKGPPGGARKIIETFPAADVRPVVSATWYDDGLYGMIEGRFYSCPVCKAQNVGKSNFCPNCGAYMREVTINGN